MNLVKRPSQCTHTTTFYWKTFYLSKVVIKSYSVALLEMKFFGVKSHKMNKAKILIT